MRSVVLFVCLAASPSGFAQQRLTVDQLETRIAAARSSSDWHLTQALQKLQLTQRLSTPRFEKLSARLPGQESRSQLLVLADLSLVLDLPAKDVPNHPPPGPTEQRAILARAEAASENTPGRLPDFDATADTTRFHNLKTVSTSGTAAIPTVVPVPLLLNRSIDAVTYREGRVFLTQTTPAEAPVDSLKTGVESWDGLYGLLSKVLNDMHAAQPEWLRWEQSQVGKLAVFRFSVDQDHAHFPLRTVIDPSPKRGYIGHPGYRAEVALDPLTGAVFRFVLRAILDPGQHVSRADVVVEFNSVTVNGNSFLAPRKAVTIGVTQSLIAYYNLGYQDYESRFSQEIGPLMHVMDTEYVDYRTGHWSPPVEGDHTFLQAAIRVTGELVTVKQLEKLVAAIHLSDDSAIAARLEQMKLTQRLSTVRYAQLRDQLPGKASREALVALYDLSVFEDLPPTDLAPESTPDSDKQSQIVSKAVAFVARTTHKMPDLFATRDLSRFEDLQVVRGTSQPLAAEVKPLAMVDQSTGVVHFRDGQEVVDDKEKIDRKKPPLPGLDTWGIFGPILEIVITDVLHSKIEWSHWERGPSGLLAVFRYEVPERSSHYDVRFCCYLGDDGLPSSFSAKPGYHGELAIDPNTGTIVRLVLKADLRQESAQSASQEKSPLLRNDVLVEYGAVDIANKQYICPLRSISVMTTWTLGSKGPIRQPMSRSESTRAAKKALALMEFSRVNAINEVSFSNYHVFRSEMRIVPNPAEPEAPKK